MPTADGRREDVVHIMDGMYVSLSNGSDSAMRQKEVLPFVATWMELESIMLGERRQTGKTNAV